nr:phage antirepressor KilAC domain-containing protein [Caproicibacter fermentans]
MLTAYKEEKEGRAAAETKVKELTPKATYCDHMLDNPGLVPISSIAKDFGMSARALNKMLHNYGVQYKQGDQWLLYAKYQDCGYVGSKPVDIVRKDGSPSVKPQTQWTQLGRKFIYDLLKSNGILPIVERPPFIKKKATAKKKRVG